jgi:zinc transport system substrate-binding protein
MRGLWPYGVVIAAILGFAQAANAGEQIPKVLVSVPALKPYVDEILKGVRPSDSLIRAGQEAHDFALAPSQSKLLEAADILIIPDAGMNPLIGRLAAKHPLMKVIALTELKGATPLPYAPENPWLAGVKAAAEKTAHAHEHDHAESDAITDPHLWLDPERMAAIAPALADAMGAAAPLQHRLMKDNARALAEHLRGEVLPGLQAMFANPRGKDSIVYSKPEVPFITYHAGYQYFLKRMGITNGGDILTRPEERRGAKTLDTLLNAAKAVRIRCIISESQGGVVRRIAELSGATVIMLSPEQLPPATETLPMASWVKSDYDRFLQKTALAFAGCL